LRVVAEESLREQAPDVARQEPYEENVNYEDREVEQKPTVVERQETALAFLSSACLFASVFLFASVRQGNLRDGSRSRAAFEGARRINRAAITDRLRA
jgi:hypothetical protein